mgnify:CR=1 FL=1
MLEVNGENGKDLGVCCNGAKITQFFDLTGVSNNPLCPGESYSYSWQTSSCG